MTASQSIVRRLDIDRLRDELWLPLSWTEHSAEVVACTPDDPALQQHIRATLGVDDIAFRVTTRADMLRLIENSADLNPEFPVSGGRTPLAKVRTYLAVLRTRYADQRTQFARGRTGLALARTGLAFIGIAVVFLRLFGGGELLLFEIPLLILGLAAIVDGMLWYLPARHIQQAIKPYPPYTVPDDYTALEVSDPGGAFEFHRSACVASAQELREHWDALSPVERRRFLANDRTTLAEERTVLAYLRTLMAKARTGLAFARTGVAFAGLGIAFLRKFPPGPWSVFDWTLIVVGVAMLVEGFIWYWPGRDAAHAARHTVDKASKRRGPWDTIFPSACLYAAQRDPVAEANVSQARPGVWATTGLALERTTLADQRNAMSHLRTVMARARTGMAFIRTGFSILSVGAGLFIYFDFFGRAHPLWTAFDSALMLIGLYLIADGLRWYLAAERIKRRSTFCAAGFEIADADYSQPKNTWKRTHYHDND
ncbi:hypothetical protein BW247_01705 [Acidihalobacter ferrooxydans]|uniref:Type II secretion system protein GspE N-terminal domain-containing protein n=1 Tax=Acidihalobacter ferrooxydans TaxID=1765967 RepID=A0A1P8UL18_9GAMM|nr:hypothetical protein BW247_01705 [Acidihalobacter ferrooxydans]